MKGIFAIDETRLFTLCLWKFLAYQWYVLKEVVLKRMNNVQNTYKTNKKDDYISANNS